MITRKTCKRLALLCLPVLLSACKLPTAVQRTPQVPLPVAYNDSTAADSAGAGGLRWRDYFTDPVLAGLIDTALQNNQELNITLQDIIIARNEVRARKGEYLPFVGVGARAGIDRVSRYTTAGGAEEVSEIAPGKAVPYAVPDLFLGPTATWEVDIWRRLRNAKDAALKRYLGTIEGRNFVVTNLIAEVANSYYELLALDNQLAILNQNITIQTNALGIVRQQKEAARATELAVRRFEAEVLKTRAMQYDIQQRRVEAENRINFLLARYPRPIAVNDSAFGNYVPTTIKPGLPSQLLTNRPDVRRAEQELAASQLDVKSAKARFYPSLGISAAFGYQAFNPSYLFKTPEALAFSLAGDLVAPVVNRNAIKAAYYTANARQVQAAYDYERTVLNAYVEVANNLAKIQNLGASYALKSQQVDALTQSIRISNDLFKSARADYMEVLLTQRDALEARFELVETRQQQLGALVDVYQALGGGWR